MKNLYLRIIENWFVFQIQIASFLIPFKTKRKVNRKSMMKTNFSFQHCLNKNKKANEQ